MTVERRYALVKLAAGDYLFPSNDGRLLWRVMRYHEGPETGIDEPGAAGWYWQAARYRGTLEEAEREGEALLFSDRWVYVATWLRTRQEAIDAAVAYRLHSAA